MTKAVFRRLVCSALSFFLTLLVRRSSQVTRLWRLRSHFHTVVKSRRHWLHEKFSQCVVSGFSDLMKSTTFSKPSR